MHYYSFHVSDYIHDTAHLSNEEDLAFRRLLDLYYTQEKPIPNKTQEVARRIRMAKQIDAVQTVLEEFFDFDTEHDFWFHKRCDETIAAYQAKAQRNREIGKLGGRPKANPQETQTVSKQNPNQEPITNNHKPIKEKATSVACPDFVDQQVWNDWMTVRKDKKAKTLTQTGWKKFVNQAEKAGWSIEQAISHCCLKNWISFEAEWVAEKQTEAQRRQNVMSQLTRGLSTPKAAQPFWSQSTTVIEEIPNVEPKRLL
jgi:uncharacterized protein YdaU (DUF1376 family)